MSSGSGRSSGSRSVSTTIRTITSRCMLCGEPGAIALPAHDVSGGILPDSGRSSRSTPRSWSWAVSPNLGSRLPGSAEASTGGMNRPCAARHTPLTGNSSPHQRRQRPRVRGDTSTVGAGPRASAGAPTPPEPASAPPPSPRRRRSPCKRDARGSAPTPACAAYGTPLARSRSLAAGPGPAHRPGTRRRCPAQILAAFVHICRSAAPLHTSHTPRAAPPRQVQVDPRQHRVKLDTTHQLRQHRGLRSPLRTKRPRPLRARDKVSRYLRGAFFVPPVFLTRPAGRSLKKLGAAHPHHRRRGELCERRARHIRLVRGLRRPPTRGRR
jgi:hypothetical protein